MPFCNKAQQGVSGARQTTWNRIQELSIRRHSHLLHSLHRPERPPRPGELTGYRIAARGRHKLLNVNGQGAAEFIDNDCDEAISPVNNVAHIFDHYVYLLLLAKRIGIRIQFAGNP